MDKEMEIPPLEESFHQKPIMTSRLARRKCQALPMSELQDLGLAQHFKENNESHSSSSDSSSTSESEVEESKEQSNSRSKHMSNSKNTSNTQT